MVFCKTCDADVEAYQEEPSGYTVCTSCGHILDHSAWSSEPTFTKEGGESTVAGHFVSEVAGTHGLGRISNGRIYGFQYDATEKAGSKGKHEIERLVDLLGIRPRDDVVNSAHRLYMLAVQHNFNRGRRTAHTAAAAIYIICRQEGHPFMLLDFSDVLQVNVFVLGAIFLQLCKILRLQEHSIMTRPVDPSLFLHRFAARMGFGQKMHQVANTALRLVSSMKRDWLQTGRRPAGICGAALYIAGHIHGFPITRDDVIRIVHIGESTLEKRVNEFAGTDASGFTAIEFEQHSKEVERTEQLRLESLESMPALEGPTDLPNHGCEHLSQGTAVFAHGMCKDCFMKFLTVSGGMTTAGADPPAFVAGQAKEQAALALVDEEQQPLYLENDDTAVEPEPSNADNEIEAEMNDALHDSSLNKLAQAVVPGDKLPQASPKNRKGLRKPNQAQAANGERHKLDQAKRRKGLDGGVSQGLGSITGQDLSGAATHAETPPNECRAIVPAEEDDPAGGQTQPQYQAPDLEPPPEELSELSDDEDAYFHSAAEVRLKGIVWTAMNQDYIDKQKIKADAELKKQEKQAALMLENNDNDNKKTRAKRKRNKEDTEPMGPSKTAADGVKKMLDAKKLSSKVNYNNLDSLLDDAAPLPTMPSSPKAKRPAPQSAPAILKKAAVDAQPNNSKKPKVTFAEPAPSDSTTTNSTRSKPGLAKARKSSLVSAKSGTRRERVASLSDGFP